MYIGVLAIVAALAFVAVSVIGSFSVKPAEVTTLSMLDGSKVMLEEVESFRASDYDEAELKNFTKDMVKAYNDRIGLERVKLKKLKVSDGVAYVKTIYESTEDYSQLSGYDLYAGSYMDMMEAGYDMSVMISSVNNGIKVSEGAIIDPASLIDLNVVMVAEYISVKVPGIIEYVSTMGTKMTAVDTVRITPDEGMEDFPSPVFIFYSESK